MSEEVLSTESIAIRGINKDGVFELIKSEDGSLDVNIHRAEANFLQGSFLNGVTFTNLVAELPHSDGIINFGIIPLPTNVYSSVELFIEASLNGIQYYPLCRVVIDGDTDYYNFFDAHQAKFVRLRADNLVGDSVQIFMSVR